MRPDHCQYDSANDERRAETIQHHRKRPQPARQLFFGLRADTELVVNSDMIEFETLGPLTKVPAAGGSVEHTEVWYLAEARVGEDESEIESKILPLVKATDKLWSDWR